MTCVLPEFKISGFLLELYHGWDKAISEAQIKRGKWWNLI